MATDTTQYKFSKPAVGGEDDAWGGVLGVSKGLYHKHPKQMIDTPLSESAYVGAAIGAATCGLRPVAELMFIDFMGVCLDQIYNQAAKFRYMFGGKSRCPAGGAAQPDADAHLHPYPGAEGGLSVQRL